MSYRKKEPKPQRKKYGRHRIEDVFERYDRKICARGITIFVAIGFGISGLLFGASIILAMGYYGIFD